MLMTTVQLTGTAVYYSQMEIFTPTMNIYISLSRKFQKHFSDTTQAYGLLDHGKDRNLPVNGSGMIMSIMYNIEKIYHKHQLKCHVQQLSSQNFHCEVRMKNLME